MATSMHRRGLRGSVCTLVIAFLACEPTSATDKERWREAVKWCDTCPTWCDTDLRARSAGSLLRSYRQAARQYGYKERTNGDAWEVLQRLACIIRASDTETRQAFLRLLDDEDLAVRYSAAVHALGNRFARDAPLRVLREIARGSSVLAVHAAVRLQEWEAGIAVEL